MKKNLVFFYPSYERGGVTQILLNLLKNIHSRNLSVHIISSNKFPIKRIKKNIFFYKVNKKIKLSFLPNRFLTALNGMLTLKRLLKKVHGETIVHSMQSNIAALLICYFKNKKIIIRNSENPIFSALNSESKLTAFFVVILKLIFYNFCNGIVVNSEGSAKSLRYFVINKKLIKRIYNPYIKKINNKNFKKKKYFLSIGRLRKQKDHSTLLKAFKIFSVKNPEYKLIILGHGNLKKSLEKLSRNLKISTNVQFKGWVSNTTPYLKKAKIFILSSIYEGLGNVLLDAINYNVPCISTNCPSGPSEILLNGRGGYLVRTCSPQELANRMTYCANNYNKSLKKNRIAKKKLNRFLVKKNSLQYIKYLSSFYKK